MNLLSKSVLALFLASLMLGGCSNKQEEDVEAAAAEAVEQAQEHAEHAVDHAEEAIDDAKDAAEDAISKAREAAEENKE